MGTGTESYPGGRHHCRQCTRPGQMANFKENTGLSLPQVVQLVTLNPALELGDASRGRLENGCRADLTIFDENFNIQSTYVGGNLVYRRKE